MQDHYIPRVQLVEHNISVLFCFFSHMKVLTRLVTHLKKTDDMFLHSNTTLSTASQRVTALHCLAILDSASLHHKASPHHTVYTASLHHTASTHNTCMLPITCFPSDMHMWHSHLVFSPPSLSPSPYLFLRRDTCILPCPILSFSPIIIMVLPSSLRSPLPWDSV